MYGTAAPLALVLGVGMVRWRVYRPGCGEVLGLGVGMVRWHVYSGLRGGAGAEHGVLPRL